MSKKLDKIDRRILFELERNSRIPDTKLAKLVGRSKESVRYRIKQLQEKGIIDRFTIWIDFCKLGFMTAKIYLTIANNPKKKAEFKEYMKNEKRLFWLGFAEGAWNVGLTYFVKNNEEFYELKNELFSKFKDLILESKVTMIVDAKLCDSAFLYYEEPHYKDFFVRGSEEIDNVSRIILQEFLLNARINIVEISRKHNITVDIIRNRIKFLDDKKIIFKYSIEVDYSKIDYIFYKTFLFFSNLTKLNESKFIEYSRKIPEIIHIIRQIGMADMEVEMYCHDYHHYSRILSQLTEEFSDIIIKVQTAIMGESHISPGQMMIFDE